MLALFYRAFSFTAVLLLFTAVVSAQAVSGNIIGTVQDATGAAVPNANVTITDLDRGSVYHAQSGSDGNYSQTHLLAGRYQVKVESGGLGTFTAGATVQVDATTRLDVTLTPASVQTNVNVTDATPLLTTDRAEIATSLTGSQVQQLPVLDRNVRNLLPVIPGIQLSSFQHAASENPQQGIQVNANGQYYTANGFLLDGTENESAILGIAVINPNVDSLQEFKVSTSNYEAEFGSAAGALIQATTRSGTNELHGTAFEFLRNSFTNATDPFTQLNPPLRWNQFGGSIGGPLIKNKLFGFFDYQGTRRRTGASLITTVPTAAERNGDLTALLGDYICTDGTVSAGPYANPALVTTTEGARVAARAGMAFNPNTGDPATGAGRQVFARNGVVNIVPVAPPMAKLTPVLSCSVS
jgi:Carboxypeptidase regulatory-like domain